MTRSTHSLATIAVLISVVSTRALGQQCHGGKGGGGGGGRPPIYNPQPYPPPGGGLPYPDPYGGYPIGGPVPVFQPKVTTPPVAIQPPVAPTSQETESSYESLDAMLEETMEGVKWDVLVEHPTLGEFTKVKTFTKESEARKFVNSLEKRYWVVFEQPNASTAEFKEAKNAAQAKSLMDKFRSQGYTVSKPTPVTAKLVMNDISSQLVDSSEEEAIDFGETAITKGTSPPEESATAPTEATIAESKTGQLDAVLAPLVGLWKAVAKDAEGQLTTIELKLDANGWATLVMPTEDGGKTSVERRVAVENGELKLSNESSTVTLGKLASADANRLTLERDNGQITFVRP